ncbi:MAG TPA: type II secretion system protein GspG [Stellaceae bacterium]|nr:type II secretion system protein GspG [Stellaceae bacterium]
MAALKAGGPLDKICAARSYPSTEQGLQALMTPPPGASNWNGPYLKGDGLPADPWNHPFVYRAPSSRRGHDHDLCSRGENAQESDTAQAGWICNRTAESSGCWPRRLTPVSGREAWDRERRGARRRTG